MKIAWIKSSTLYEGGLAQEIYISGCEHNCKGCHNPELQNFEFGEEMSIKEILDRINPKFIDKAVLTGGDPLFDPIRTLELIVAIKFTYPNIKIWLYTGFTREEIESNIIMEECFEECDVVVTDRFIEGLPRTALAGSSNQRIWRK